MSGYQPGHDGSTRELSNRKSPTDWEKQKEIGDRGEQLMEAILKLGVDKYEVKNDLGATTTGNVFLEVQCETGVGTGEYRDSGLNVTKSDIWFIVLNESPPFILGVAPELLKKGMPDNTRIKDGMKDSDGSLKTKGYVPSVGGLVAKILGMLPSRK